MGILHILLNILLIVSSVFICISDNPVHSVLFLILTFCNASAILLLFNAEFLALVFIIIYVGAIAVLFLFVVMMLNVKIYSSKILSYTSIIISIIFILCLQIFLVVDMVFTEDSIVDLLRVPSTLLIDNLTNIEVLGQGLYNNFLPCFLLAGLTLLIAMISAICLTLNFSSARKNELVTRQLSRSDKFLAFFE